MIPHDLRVIHYVFTKYDEPFKTKIIELAKYFKWRITEALGIHHIRKVGIELEGNWENA